MKQSLQLKLGQQLTMTPQLQQAIRLLQLSTLDLQAEIQEALDSNPMLEINEESDGSNANSSDDNRSESAEEKAANDAVIESRKDENSNANNEESTAEGDWNDDIPTDLAVDTDWDDVYQASSSSTPLSRSEGDDIDFESRRTTNDTLQDHLSWQLNLTPMSALDREIGEAIIDAVEPSGMLGQSIEDIYAGLVTTNEELELDEVAAVLRRVQQFDPPGVASRSIKSVY